MSSRPPASTPSFSRTHLPAGTRLGLAVSGGADSVALLLLAALLAGRTGWQLRVLHVDHGLREASESDAAWVRALAGGLGLPCEVHRAALGGLAAGIEEAARAARYRWFNSVLADGGLDAVATGHTLDDQAETVLARLLRGAWTGGLGGIYPVVRAADLPGPQSAGVVVRPLLCTPREELRAWLRGQGQGWREDETNADPRFTRNRIRAELLPALAAYNPQVPEQLAQMSELARGDESYWQAEVARLLPALVLPGRAVRGGGRASSTVPGEGSLAIEAARLQAFAPALQRRLLRAAAAELGSALDFAETARVLALLDGPAGSAPRREQLTAELRAERTARELRFVRAPAGSQASQPAALAVPGPGEGGGRGGPRRAPAGRLAAAAGRRL